MKLLKPKEEQEEHVDIRITLVALTLSVSLVGLIILLSKEKDYFPSTYYISVFTLIFSIFMILISGLYGNSIIRRFKRYRKKRKYDIMSKDYFIEFKKFIARFNDLLSDKDDNIPYVLKEIKNSTIADKGYSTSPFCHINLIDKKFIRELYDLFKSRCDQFGETKQNFISLIKEFETIFSIYDELYIRCPTEEIKKTGMDKIAKHHKEYYEKARNVYISFIIDYQSFAADANENFKDSYFRTYFEQPDILV